MAIFKCKMCGGDLEITEGSSVATCEYCGTKQTLPKIGDDRRASLFDRANYFRRCNEFDKASGIFEQLLAEDNTDAEVYWSLVLCRYGIEYVEDPATHKRVPTVNRAQFTSILEDKDYKSAIQSADRAQREVYEAEAKAIDAIQKGILNISKKEEPFDVFICYKETDEQGRRTIDSVLAMELYKELTRDGLKVFFARITLEDKLGVAYEPYIFAALNSAKVMVVVGTKPEYFNAVWVKNEWSRYLALIKNGAKKVLIPAYRDMNPYNLPEEFGYIQAQDLGKVGAVQDIVHGIEKIAKAQEKATVVKETVVNGGTVVNTTPLLKRAFMFLEDGKWQDANIYCEKVLDIDPKNAEAYLGKLMVELQVKNRKQLADCAEPFDSRDNYSKVLRFGDDKIEAEMRGYIKHINDRNENARLTGIYNNASNAMNTANSEDAYKNAAHTFQSIQGFKDADALAEKCLDKAEVCRKDAVYSSAKSKMTGEKVASYEEAIKIFHTISGWKDADEQIYACQKRIEEIKAKEEADRLEAERKAEERRIAEEKAAKKRKKIIAITTPIVCACIAFIIVLNTVIIPTAKYNKAVEKYGQEWADTVKNASVGDTIVFGTYEQDNNTSNGKEAIEWTALDKNGMSLLLISEKGLDCRQYYTSYTDVTWETCSLRKWMNGTFLNSAFSTEEQAQIQSTTVSADKNPEYSTNPGNATTDKVFLLSITEVNKYFSSDEDRKCLPTEYAIAQGAWTSDSYTKGGAATCWWWLRSPGSYQGGAAFVFYDGSVRYDGRGVHSDRVCVRPAMWISLE